MKHTEQKIVKCYQRAKNTKQVRQQDAYPQYTGVSNYAQHSLFKGNISFAHYYASIYSTEGVEIVSASFLNITSTSRDLEFWPPEPNDVRVFSSRVSKLTRDIDIAVLSVCPSVTFRNEMKTA